VAGCTAQDASSRPPLWEVADKLRHAAAESAPPPPHPPPPHPPPPRRGSRDPGRPHAAPPRLPGLTPPPSSPARLRAGWRRRCSREPGCSHLGVPTRARRCRSRRRSPTRRAPPAPTPPGSAAPSPRDRLVRDETCPVSTERWTRRVHFVREGGGCLSLGSPHRPSLVLLEPFPLRPRRRGADGRGARRGGRVRRDAHFAAGPARLAARRAARVLAAAAEPHAVGLALLAARRRDRKRPERVRRAALHDERLARRGRRARDGVPRRARAACRRGRGGGVCRARGLVPRGLRAGRARRAPAGAGRLSRVVALRRARGAPPPTSVQSGHVSSIPLY
jgi:hypothetical protein